jgi:hypothetical protein
MSYSFLTAILIGLSLMVPPDTSQASASASDIKPVQFQFDRANAYNEKPPDFILIDGKPNYFATTDHTYFCTGDHTMLADKVNCTTSLYWSSSTYLSRDPDEMPEGYEHRRNYYGAFAVAKVRDNIISAMHGENKNTYRPDNDSFYQNTVYKGSDALVPDCFSGYTKTTGEYQDCYAAYSGFVGTTTNGLDNGPAVWPKYGYSSHGRTRRLGHGARHPSIIDGGDGYLYMYYYDTGASRFNSVTGHALDSGIRVARSRRIDLGRNWSTWVKKDRRWVRSLPKGVSVKSSAKGLASPSPAQSSPLFSATTTTFEIARVADQKKWIGVHQGPDYNSPTCINQYGRQDHVWKTYLRTTTDMVHWSAPVHVAGLDACGYPGERLAYPEFLRANGTTTRVVEPEGFYLVGAGLGSVHRAFVTTQGL